MKLNEIKRLCLAVNTFRLVNAPVEAQWLGDGFNLYKVENIHLTEAALPSLFGLTMKQFNRCSILETRETMDIYRADNYCGEEIQLYHVGDVWAFESRMLALRSDLGLLFLPLENLKPTVYTDDTDFRLRLEGGLQRIAVYNGMFCDALLLPVDTQSAGMIMDKLARISSFQLYGQKEEVTEP